MQSKFLEQCGLTIERIESVDISEKELKSIFDDFKDRQIHYQRNAQSISDILLQDAGVHSVRYRVKNPYSLTKKIVRKKEADATRIINIDNYDEEITDLSGVRALHLFKNDWSTIHDFITKTWDLKEPAVVYYRKGDSEELLKMFDGKECILKEHPFGYRSVHYIIKNSLTRKQAYVEIQVRTIFEEGWSEVDHKIRYPEFSDDPLITNLLMLLNRSAGAADEMSGFVQDLKIYIENNNKEKAEQVKQLQDALGKLEIPENDKNRIEDLAKSLQHFSYSALPHISPASIAALEKAAIGLNVGNLFTPSFIDAMNKLPHLNSNPIPGLKVIGKIELDSKGRPVPPASPNKGKTALKSNSKNNAGKQ